MPMIMIAAGAGFAPLRAFLQERQWLLDQGHSLAPAHLYFGVTAPDQVCVRRPLGSWLVMCIHTKLSVCAHIAFAGH